MTEMRTWTVDEVRAAVAKALASRSSPNPWYLADIVLAALGISGDVTVVPGRLQQLGYIRDGVYGGGRPPDARGIDVYCIPPHIEPGQP